MQFAGVRSWRLATSGSDLLTHALFVRQSAALIVDQPAAPLIGPVPDREAVLTAEQRRDAAHQWLLWWQRLLAHESAVQRGDDDADLDPRTRMRARIAAREAVSDPPDYTALADSAELRLAARRTFQDYRAWTRVAPRIEPKLDCQLVRQTVADVAFDKGVEENSLSAAVVVLPIAGRWWQRALPGMVLASTAVETDTRLAQVVLREAFVSGIAG